MANISQRLSLEHVTRTPRILPGDSVCLVSGCLHIFFVTVQLLWLQIHDSCGNRLLSLSMQAREHTTITFSVCFFHHSLCSSERHAGSAGRYLKTAEPTEHQWHYDPAHIWPTTALDKLGAIHGPERGQRGSARGSICRSGVDQYHCASLIILSLAAWDQRSL